MGSTQEVESVLAVLGEVYAEVKRRPRPVALGDHLLDDLDIDSLDAFELLEVLEDRLGVPLIESVADHLGDMATVEDFVGRVLDAVANAATDAEGGPR